MGGGENWTLSVSIDIEDLYRDLLSISLISLLMDPAGAAEQDAPSTGWVEAKIGRTAFLLTLHCAAARGVATGRGSSMGTYRKRTGEGTSPLRTD